MSQENTVPAPPPPPQQLVTGSAYDYQVYLGAPQFLAYRVNQRKVWMYKNGDAQSQETTLDDNGNFSFLIDQDPSAQYLFVFADDQGPPGATFANFPTNGGAIRLVNNVMTIFNGNRATNGNMRDSQIQLNANIPALDPWSGIYDGMGNLALPDGVGLLIDEGAYQPDNNVTSGASFLVNGADQTFIPTRGDSLVTMKISGDAVLQTNGRFMNVLILSGTGNIFLADSLMATSWVLSSTISFVVNQKPVVSMTTIDGAV